MDGAQIEPSHHNLAFELFGANAFVLGYDAIIPAVHLCVKGIVATTYNRWRKTHGTFLRGLDRKREKMEELLAGELRMAVQDGEIADRLHG